MTGYSIAFWLAEIRGRARCQLHFSVMAYQSIMPVSPVGIIDCNLLCCLHIAKMVKADQMVGNEECIAFSGSKIRCNMSQKWLPGSWMVCSSYESSIPATTFICIS